jgi:PKD repeat protein
MLIPTVNQPCNQGDGTITVTFGYTSRHSTVVTLPVGEKNRFSPGDENRGQPVTFLPGIHRNIFTVTFPANGTNMVWNLMNTAVGAGNVPGLKAGMDVEPSAGYAPLTVRFRDRSAGGTVQNPLTGIWDFGDGTTGDGDEATHRYLLPGTYPVRRIVSTSCGSETVSGKITVYGTDFLAEPVPGSARTFRFTDQSTGNPDVRFWDFNDGFSSWETSPVHTYASPGKYAVKLAISGKAGSGTVVRTLTVE